MRELLLERTSLDERSSILRSATSGASLGWLVNLSRHARNDHYPGSDKPPKPDDRCLVTRKDADELCERALCGIEDAAKEGILIEHPKLAYLLYSWRELAADDGEAVKKWTASQLEDDHAVACFARAFTSESWGQSLGMFGLGDLVARRNDRASVETIDEILDRDRLRARVEELVSSGTISDAEKEAVQRFLTAWNAPERF
jgi:predicted KAP-like P-loop ATPase